MPPPPRLLQSCRLFRFPRARACPFARPRRRTNGHAQVHLVPHSHCDPGWLETFEGYFQHDVSRILASTLVALGAHASARVLVSQQRARGRGRPGASVRLG